MTDPIEFYYIADFPSPAHAEKIAFRIADAARETPIDGALRPVIWTASPLASTGRLYLSTGAVQLSQEHRIPLTVGERVPAEELPPHRALLLGEPQDRG